MKEVIKQIPISTAWYFTGFVDGEGSFNVSLIPRNDYRFGWKIYLTFNVAQRDQTVLALMKKHFGAGRLELRKDGVWNYSVNNLNSLRDIIVPFFERYNFLSSSKKTNFSIFKRIVETISNGKHFTREGLEKIIELREKLNEGKGRKRKYSLSDYQKSRESPETNTSESQKIAIR
ncbi:MAG: homing endonuclease LAGLIDADG/HNH [Parcubacteria group bacterium Licking1014_17]|nr:MAG: homing endonuclease LAGLIDADG/HNH [Parcubacteria group bacterium Licking1014_17]